MKPHLVVVRTIGALLHACVFARVTNLNADHWVHVKAG